MIPDPEIESAILDFSLTRTLRFDGALLEFLDADGNPVDVSTCDLLSQVRKGPKYPVILDLNPGHVAGHSNRVEIPPIECDATTSLPDGKFRWDLVLIHPQLGRLDPPVVVGSFDIGNNISHPS